MKYTILFISTVIIFLSGCITNKNHTRVTPKGKSLKISLFECDNIKLAKTIKNVFAQHLADRTNSEIILNEQSADLEINGVINLEYASSSMSKNSGVIASESPIPVLWGGKSKSASGSYMTSISVTVTENGKYLFSETLFQSANKGHIPNNHRIAINCAERIRRRLIREGYTYGPRR